jgi:hypothetical protein
LSKEREAANIDSIGRATDADKTAFKTEEDGLFLIEDGALAEAGRKNQSKFHLDHKTIVQNFYLSSFPSPRVAKPNPYSEYIPTMTQKLNNNPQADTSQRHSCSKGTIV